MSLKSNKIIIPVFIIFVVLAGVIFFLKSSPTSANKVKILDYGFSICTQDVPSSSCGPYEVTVQSTNGKLVYRVPGYHENTKDREHYEQLSSQITKAKEQKATVVLEINDKSEIISVQ